MNQLIARGATGALLLVLALCVASGNAAGSERSVRGHVFGLPTDGLVLDDGTRFQRSPATRIASRERGGAADLAIGMEVEILARTDPSTGVLVAERITVLSNLDISAHGVAMIEGRENTPEGTVLFADGRRLLLNANSHFVPDKESSDDRPPALEPSAFIRYRGHGTLGGAIQVEEFSVWPNVLEEKELKIYREYEPQLLLPARADSGPQVLKVNKNRYRVFTDSALQVYLDRVGTSLLPEPWKETDTRERAGLQFWFIAAQYERAQASAFPSGVVVVNIGLLQLVENEAQLAFALAHEVAHVTQEHAWHEYQYQRGRLLFLRWSTAGLGYMVESAIRRGYQRSLEEQADRVALWYMTQAGYDPREGLRFLERLESVQEGLSALFWDTHRSYGARQAALWRELARHSLAGLSYDDLRRDTSEFAFFRARVPSVHARPQE